MTAPFPHRYEVALAGEGGGSALLSSPDHPPLIGGAPPQFGGSAAWWSPEELLLAAVALCHFTTVRAFAAREQLATAALSARAEAVLDKTRQGIAFTAIKLHVAMRVAAADVERAEALLQTAKKFCIIANSLSVPVELVGTVSAD